MKNGYLYSSWLKLRAALLTLRVSFQAAFLMKTREDFDRLIYNWSEGLINLMQVKLTVDDPHHLNLVPGKRYIIMCNHASLFDIPLTYLALPKYSIRMLSKKELAKIPLFGRGMQQAGFPFIDRKNRMQAIKDLRAAQKLMEDGIVLWIAPEGTRSKDGHLQPFKKGAFITAIQSEAVIIPLAIKGAFEIWPHNSKYISTQQEITIKVGAPIDATEYELADKAKLITHCQQTMASLLDEELKA